MSARALEEDHRPRLVCANGHVTWRNPRIVVGTLPVRDGRVHLARRDIEPGRGRWSYPGGFLELGEALPGRLEVLLDGGPQRLGLLSTDGRDRLQQLLGIRDHFVEILHELVPRDLDGVGHEPLLCGEDGAAAARMRRLDDYCAPRAGWAC